MSRDNFQSVLSLFQGRSTLRCNDVVRALESLGFEVRDGSKGGHKVFIHAGLNDFHAGSFNCDHGRNPQIKPAYIKKIRNLLEQYSDELSQQS
jgi:hypothetical protein